MRTFIFPCTLLASALVLPLTAHADAIDDFVLTGGGFDITFSLPASPPGNESTCPPTSPSCLPGSETAFSASTLVTTNGVSAMETIQFPTLRFGGGLFLSLPPGRLLGDSALFTPNAATPTFTIGTFELGSINLVNYNLSITPETTAQTPEPSTLGLLGTGVLGLIGLARKRLRLRPGSAI